MPNCYEDMEDKFKTWRKQLSNYHAKILYCLDELGLVCAYEVCVGNKLTENLKFVSSMHLPNKLN